MTKLEENLRTNLHAVGSRLPDVDGRIVGQTPSAKREKWHGPAWAIAAAAIVLIVVGGVALLTRTQTPGETVPLASSPPEGLLYPPVEANVLDTQVSEPRIQWAVGLVSSPEGVVYRVSVGPTTGELDPDDDRRDIGGRSFAVQRDDDNGVVGYAYLDMCATVVVQAPADSPPWNREASSLLAVLTVDGRQVTGVLPTDWQSHGAGLFGPLYQVSFEVELSGDAKAIALRQMPGTPVAALPGMSAGRISETTLNGLEAWRLEFNDGYAALVWMEDANAVMLEGQDVTIEELKVIASTLETNQRAALWRHSDVGPTDTAPLYGSEGTDRELCGPTRLDLTTGP